VSEAAFLGLVSPVRSEQEGLGQAAPNRVHGPGGAHVGRVERMVIEDSKFAGLPEHVENRTGSVSAPSSRSTALARVVSRSGRSTT
jgi:hypothetical protein